MTPARTFTSAAAAAALFLLSWALLHTAWYDDAEIVDTPIYEAYGEAIEDGAVPYRDVAIEYPPGALPAFVLPALASDGSEGYRDAFEGLMALFGVATVALVAMTLRGLAASRGRTLAVLGFVAVFPLLLGPVVLTRFDLYPAALLAAAVAALAYRRDRLGSGLLGAAVAVKLYPAVVVPVALAWIWRRRGRNEAVVCGAVLAAVLLAAFLPFLVAAPRELADSLGHQLSRPLQIESLGAAFYLAGHHLFGLDVEMRSGHGSQNLHGAGTAAVALVTSALQVAVLAWIWLRRPETHEELVRWSAAALVAFVALGKVLSPQFLIWLVPAVAVVGGLAGVRAGALLAAALVLTQLWFPSRYWELPRDLDGGVAALVLARDLVLVALLVVLVGGRRPLSSRDEVPRSS